ncbi:mechanosensitive ion channel family protein [Patescibacteria group bacterium]|nr:mechanosensitive ion channel family protein [Patescibacteria group bacterium]
MPTELDLSRISTSLENVPILTSLFSIEFLGNTLAAYLTAIVFVFAVYLVSKIISWILKNYAKRIIAKTKNGLDDAVFETVHRSVTFILVLTAVYFSLRSLVISASTMDILVKVIFVLFTFKITLEIERFLAFAIKEYFEPLANKQKGFAKAFVPSILRVSKFIVWALAFLLVLSNLGYNIASLLAGLGLGGLAFALAAQEMLSNFFGSVSILSDQPFKVGDFVNVEGYSGTIVNVGLRSTTIQTIDKSMVSIPNKTVAAANIENISKRNAYKVEQTLAVKYDTSLKDLQAAVEMVKSVIRKDKDTDSETMRVNFVEFGESALEIKVFYYITDTSSYARILDVRERINLKIKQGFEKISVQMAFPTQSLYIENAKDLVQARLRSKAR